MTNIFPYRTDMKLPEISRHPVGIGLAQWEDLALGERLIGRDHEGIAEYVEQPLNEEVERSPETVGPIFVPCPGEGDPQGVLWRPH